MHTLLLRSVWCSTSFSGVQRIYFTVNTRNNRSYATKKLHTSNSISSAEIKKNANILTTEKPLHRNIGTKPNIRQNKSPLTVDIALQKLETHFKLNGYLNYEQCIRLMETLESQQLDSNNVTSTQISEEQAHFILAACVPDFLPAQNTQQRLQLFQRVWHYLSKRGQLTERHYHTQLKVLQQNRSKLTDFRVFLADVAICNDRTADKMPTPIELYGLLLDVSCASGNMRQATELLAEMRSHKIALHERNFNALILGHARNCDLAGMQTILENMNAAGVPLSLETQTALTIAYLENSQTSQAIELLHRWHGKFDAQNILSMLRAALHTPIDTAVLDQLVHEFPAEYLGGGEVPVGLRNLCIELLHNGKLSLVTTIVSTLPKPVYNENQDIDSFGVFLLQHLFRSQNSSTQIIAISQMLHNSGKNTRALHIATEIALRRMPDSALTFLETLAADGSELRPHYFWPLILYNWRRTGEAGIFRTLGQMSQLKVACDKETITQYVLPYLRVTLEQPQQALKQLDECGVRTSQVFTPIISQLLHQQKIDAVHELLEMYPTRMDLTQLLNPLGSLAVHMRATKSYQRFAKLIVALSTKCIDRKADFVGALVLQMLTPRMRLRADLNAVQRFVNEMNRGALKMSLGAIEIIHGILKQQHQSSNALGEIVKNLHNMCDRSLTITQDNNSGGIGTGPAFTPLSFIKHPRDMSRDELECHLIELEAKQLNARGVLRRLLQLNVRDGCLERALEIKAKCDTLQVQSSPGMLASVFDMYIKVKDFSNAQQTMQQLQQNYPGFRIDEHKLIDYAALLVNSKQLNAAKEMLRQHSSKHKVNGGDYVIKNVWNLLTSVATYAAEVAKTTSTQDQQELPNMTLETFIFLRNLGYCKSHNALLGPIVRERLLRGDLLAAVVEFRQLADNHKHTPLQFELMVLLVRLSNGCKAEMARYNNMTPEQAKQLLVELTDIVSRMHGVANMNSALLLAFAEAGTDNQLRRLIINPEFRINHDLLLKNCEHLGQEGAVRTLLRLAHGSRGLQRIINEQLIYDMLLSKFVKANNYKAALDLYERLQADDELNLSQEFLRNLVNLLKVNNIEIPSNIALRAQIL